MHKGEKLKEEKGKPVIKDFKSHERGRVAKPLVTVLLGLVAVLILIFGALRLEKLNTEQNRELTYQAIKKATVQCYANEGRYPADLRYLEDNYEVKIDREKFNILYDAIGSNIMPNINVFIN